MIASFQKQFQIKVLPAFSVDEKVKLRETDLNEVVRMVESVLPQYVNGDIDVTITLLEKNLMFKSVLTPFTILFSKINSVTTPCQKSIFLFFSRYDLQVLVKCILSH